MSETPVAEETIVEPTPIPEKSDEALKGEMLGYQLDLTIQKALEDVAKAERSRAISRTSAVIIRSALENMGQSMMAQGIQYINIA